MLEMRVHQANQSQCSQFTSLQCVVTFFGRCMSGYGIEHASNPTHKHKSSLRKQLCCIFPSLFLLPVGSHFISFVVSLSFKSSLQQRFSTKPNGCRESCSGVNCSVSARLKPADGVACNSACKVCLGQF